MNRPSTLRMHPVVWLAVFAVALRFVVFLGRGDYVAYDEGWYLLLGRNLFEGNGFSLAGLRHVTLSPLFPILAGALDQVVGDAVWAGRAVAAVASGLLVVPCWFLFRRLGERRDALLGCAVVATLPALAPFGAPRWVGWDLWVGAEPVYHLFLFSGIALFLSALDTGALGRWAAAGAAFSLAYLARPEAVLVFGLLGLAGAGTVLARTRWRRLPGLALCAAAFALVAAPYWVYLHDALGRWALSGRAVEVQASVERAAGGVAGSGADAASPRVIEQMLWGGTYQYAQRLYALHPSDTRMANGYWGVPPRDEAGPAYAYAADPASSAAAGAEGPVATAAGPAPGASETAAPAATAPAVVPSAAAAAAEAAPADEAAAASQGAEAGAASAAGAPDGLPGPLALYGRAMRILVPLYLWPFVLLGLVGLGRYRRDAALLVGTVLAAGLAIAFVVAVDPRTQLFVLPVLAILAARGALRLSDLLARRMGPDTVSPGLVPVVVAGGILLGLVAEDASRTWNGVTLATDQQLIGTELRLLGEGIRGAVPEDGAVMSWHPAVAVHARRDWRPLPLAELPRVVRYARASDGRYIVLGGHNPSPVPSERLPREYLVAWVGEDLEIAPADWTIDVTAQTPLFALGVLRSR